jgi:hypothetical protein
MQNTIEKRSYKLLKDAWTSARISRGYEYEKTRQNILEKFKNVFDGKTPYDWQIDISEALLLGLDCIVIAGTGAGKTMPFAMPLLVDNTCRKILIISLLNKLEYDQVSFISLISFSYCLFSLLQAERFNKLGLTSTAVNGDIWSKTLHDVCQAMRSSSS